MTEQTTVDPDHMHHWIIDQPNGPTSNRHLQELRIDSGVQELDSGFRLGQRRKQKARRRQSAQVQHLIRLSARSDNRTNGVS